MHQTSAGHDLHAHQTSWLCPCNGEGEEEEEEEETWQDRRTSLINFL